MMPPGLFQCFKMTNKGTMSLPHSSARSVKQSANHNNWVVFRPQGSIAQVGNCIQYLHVRLYKNGHVYRLRWCKKVQLILRSSPRGKSVVHLSPMAKSSQQCRTHWPLTKPSHYVPIFKEAHGGGSAPAPKTAWSLQ